jgi:hypothetical protein
MVKPGRDGSRLLFRSQCNPEYTFVTPQVPDSSPPPAARVVVPAGCAAAGCTARRKHLLRTSEGGEES